MTARSSILTATLAFVSTALAGCGGGSSSGGSTAPATTYTASLSATSLSFSSTVGVQSASQTVTLTNTGTGALTIASITPIPNIPALGLTASTCNSPTLAVNSSCTLSFAFLPTSSGTFTSTLTITDNATNSPQTVLLTGTATAAASPYSVSITPSSLTFPATSVGTSSSPQTLTILNTGTGLLTLGTVTVTGTNSAFFIESASTCGATLAAGATCTAAIVFSPTASGSDSAVFTVTDNAANSPQTVAFTGTAIGTATSALTVDCSVAAVHCADAFTGAFSDAASQLATDPAATGGFHGYADPSLRKDPNSNFTYLAYSWPHISADGTHVVDLHLASSSNAGASFTYTGPLYQSSLFTQPAPVSATYSTVNDTATEVVDLIPIPLSGAGAGQTLWVQAHQSYLDPPQGSGSTQFNATSVISVSAVQLATPAAANSPTALLGLSTAPEGRLGTNLTDATRGVTQNLNPLSPLTAKCSYWGQPALWYQSGTLYLTLECNQDSTNIDANYLAHFVYSTTPTGANANTWTWAFVGEFGTAAQAAKLGTIATENTTYQFFTEPEFALSKSGQLLVILSPSVFSQTGIQPVVQYGCRAFPITLTPTGVSIPADTTTGALAIVAKVTENDLYSGANEGPAACTYEPTAVNGIVMGRKYENDPTYGFYLYPLNSGILP